MQTSGATGSMFSSFSSNKARSASVGREAEVFHPELEKTNTGYLDPVSSPRVQTVPPITALPGGSSPNANQQSRGSVHIRGGSISPDKRGNHYRPRPASEPETVLFNPVHYTLEGGGGGGGEAANYQPEEVESVSSTDPL